MLFPPPLFITFILKAHSCVITQLESCRGTFLCPAETLKQHLFCITAHTLTGKSVPQLRIKRLSRRFIAIQDLPGLFVSFHLYCSQRHSHANSAFFCVCVCVIDSDLAAGCECAYVCVCLLSRCVSLMGVADRKRE